MNQPSILTLDYSQQQPTQVKVDRVRFSVVMDELTNTVHESTKKKIEEENGGVEITKNSMAEQTR